MTEPVINAINYADGVRFRGPKSGACGTVRILPDDRCHCTGGHRWPRAVDPHRVHGPHGTFTEAALATQPDLSQCTPVPLISVPEVLSALDDGEVDYGFVPVENAIEGAVNVTQDALAFDFDFLIQREVVVNVQLDLMALPGTATAEDLSAIHTVLSFPVAIAQCRAFLHTRLPNAEIEAATSTALAARRIGEERLVGVAAIASPTAAEIYGLETVVAGIEDHRENQTRFLLLAKGQVPTASGNDKTSIVVFQQQNEPGSLLGILMSSRLAVSTCPGWSRDRPGAVSVNTVFCSTSRVTPPTKWLPIACARSR